MPGVSGVWCPGQEPQHCRIPSRHRGRERPSGGWRALITRPSPRGSRLILHPGPSFWRLYHHLRGLVQRAGGGGLVLVVKFARAWEGAGVSHSAAPPGWLVDLLRYTKGEGAPCWPLTLAALDPTSRALHHPLPMAHLIQLFPPRPWAPRPV